MSDADLRTRQRRIDDADTARRFEVAPSSLRRQAKSVPRLSELFDMVDVVSLVGMLAFAVFAVKAVSG
jgi:hypothetical protein